MPHDAQQPNQIFFFLYKSLAAKQRVSQSPPNKLFEIRIYRNGCNFSFKATQCNLSTLELQFQIICMIH